MSPSARPPSTVERFETVPPLGRSFVRGAVGSGLLAARRALPGAGAPLVLPDVAYRVDRVPTGTAAVEEHLRAYQRTVGEPGVDGLAPGFLHVLGFPLATALMVRGDFPLPLVGLVHVANAVRVERPVLLGATLAVQAWAQDLRPHRRGVLVDVVTEVDESDHDGAPAYRGVSTYLAKGFRLDDAVAPDDGPRPDFVPPVPTARWRLGAGTGRTYGAVSGDRNPIHTSALGAKAFGFPRSIAHGMYTAARALAEVGPARGDAYDWTVEFARPVLLPGTVDVAITRDTATVGGPASFTYVAWDARRDVEHLHGTVVGR